MHVILLLLATVDLPNANLPGNSPSLPNANLPGSLPDDNPVTLPDSDTSLAVIKTPDELRLNFTPEGLPKRNPTQPPTVDELAAAQTTEQQQLEQQLGEAREDAAKARDEAQKARDEADQSRDEAAKLRDQNQQLQQNPPNPQNGEQPATPPPQQAPAE